MPLDDWTRANLASWNDRVPAHAGSPDYALDRLVREPDRISDVVAFDRPRMGDVAALLAPGGRLFIREAHPVLWALGSGA